MALINVNVPKELKIDLTIHSDKQISDSLLLIIQNQNKIMADLTALTAAVQKDTEVDQSAITLLQGLKAALDAAGTDPVALKALSDQLGQNTDALAAAVAANTPAA